MAGRINERNPFFYPERSRGVLELSLDLVGGHVLRDAAGLACDDIALADEVKERRFTVVDMPHHDHDRRPFHCQRFLYGSLHMLWYSP